ncbi:MAG: hypothetical protein V2J89_17475, partial [Halieaceae bacterium]|nr:hypothetical protein [Halieaceae bacterium]
MSLLAHDGNGGSAGLAPIALFVYRRPEHTARLLASLAANPSSLKSRLYVFSDAPACETDTKGVAEVRALLRKLQGFAHVDVRERTANYGCAANIIDGVGQVLCEHDRVIVLEDDLELSPRLLDFMNRALEIYAERDDIISISAASPPPQALGIADDDLPAVYLAPRSVPWGWATWRDRWQQVDWLLTDYARNRWRPDWRRRISRGGNDLLTMLADQMAGRIDSWNVRFNHAQAMDRSYSLYPRHSYVRNIGLDGSGRHCRAADSYEVKLERAKAMPDMPPAIQPD